MQLSDSAIAGYAKRAGFTGQNIVIATAVALAESGGETTKRNDGLNKDGTVDFGVWQINSIHAALLAKGNWQNPTDNAFMAVTIFKEAGARWTPWSSFNEGKYLAYMGRAMAADPDDAGTIIESGLPNRVNSGGTGTTGFASINEFTTLISNPETWWRVGYFVSGLVCLGIAAKMMLKSSGVGDKVLGAVTKVVL